MALYIFHKLPLTIPDLGISFVTSFEQIHKKLIRILFLIYIMEDISHHKVNCYETCKSRNIV